MAPDPEAGWSSPEIHAIVQKDLVCDIFYAWRNGELAQQELTRTAWWLQITRKQPSCR
jgi:hypothetical protein